MEEMTERRPSTCANRKTNNFRCARDENGVQRTPNTDGSDCRECPKFIYAPPKDAEKAAAADKEAKRGAAIGTAVLVFAAILLAAGIFALTVLLKSCAG